MRYYRKLRSFDAADLADHLLRLDPSGRSSRFSAAVADETVRAYVAKIDWSRAVVIGCYDGVALRAVAELHPGAGLLPRDGEFAVTVETACQGEGIGTELLRRMILVARNRMIARLRMVCLLDNGPMRHIARQFGAHLDIEDGQAWADLRLPFPDAVSLSSEAWGEGLGIAAAVHARQRDAGAATL
jgi:GNAT superfamily N-acetyltransferase